MNTLKSYLINESCSEGLSYTMPIVVSDYENIHKEIQGIVVTLKLLWREYIERCKGINCITIGGVGYIKFYFDIKNIIIRRLNEQLKTYT